MRSHYKTIAVCFSLSLFLVFSQSASAQCLSGPGGRTTVEGAVTGAILGAIVGAANNRNDRNEGAQNGAAAGAVVGAIAGCAMAQHQALLAAREETMNADAARLEEQAASIEAYNATLEEDVNNLRQQVAQARVQQQRSAGALQGAQVRLTAAQSGARTQLDDVNYLIAQVENRLAQLPPSTPDYARIRDALMRHRIALYGARAHLQSIMAMTV